ncbi:MAG: hypothetical protein R3F59_31010 [Myxococcota bacterium]
MVFSATIAAFGTLLSLPFVGVGLFFPPLLLGLLVTGIWPAFGAWGIARMWRKGNARLEVLRRGRATVGEVTAVGSQSVAYVYEVADRRHAGTVEVEEGAPVGVGRRVHVLYLQDDADRSEIWPLLG